MPTKTQTRRALIKRLRRPRSSRKGPAPNTLRADPARTATLRRRFAAELKRRFSRLKRELVLPVQVEDAFGLGAAGGPPTFAALAANKFCATGEGGKVDPTCGKDDADSGVGPRPATGGREFTAAVPSPASAAATAFKATLAALGSLGAKAAHLEHLASSYLKDRLGDGISRLPPKVAAAVHGSFAATKVGTAALFANWTAAQTLAERVSREKGSTPEQARRLRGLLSSLDLKTFEVLKVGSLAGAHFLHGPTAAAALFPPATASYLAYNTARHPMATLRAATGLVKDAAGSVAGGAASAGRSVAALFPSRGPRPPRPQRRQARPGVEELIRNRSANDRVRKLADELAKHQYDDWYVALLSAALTETGSLEEALKVAAKAHKATPQNPTGAASPPPVSTPPLPPTVNAGRWAFQAPDQQAQAFASWLRATTARLITSPEDKALWDEYARAGFARGSGRAFDEVGKGRQGAAARVPAQLRGTFAHGAKDQFLREVFSRPKSADRVRLISQAAFADYEGVTGAMAVRMGRVVADGLLQGWTPHRLARELAQVADLTLSRALQIARDEVVRSASEGTLDAMERLGVQEVTAAVEWTTSGLPTVCPRCAALEGVVLTVDEARGLIPLHSRCNCSWLPAVTKEKGQVRSAAAVRDAFDEADVNRAVAGRRPKPVANSEPVAEFSRAWVEVANAFCATGRGGGVDPSCGRRGVATARAPAAGKARGKSAVYPKAALAAAQARARAKAAAALVPTRAAARAAGRLMDALGADDYETNIRGNSKDRAASRKRLLAEFGDGVHCPCVYCGRRLEESGPNGVTRDKIVVARAGGRYQHGNLVPACLRCNQSRGDKPFSSTPAAKSGKVRNEWVAVARAF
jgi:hypothetical protein